MLFVKKERESSAILEDVSLKVGGHNIELIVHVAAIQPHLLSPDLHKRLPHKLFVCFFFCCFLSFYIPFCRKQGDKPKFHMMVHFSHGR